MVTVVSTLSLRLFLLLNLPQFPVPSSPSLPHPSHIIFQTPISDLHPPYTLTTLPYAAQGRRYSSRPIRPIRNFLPLILQHFLHAYKRVLLVFWC